MPINRERLIDVKEIKSEMVLINGSSTDYITKEGIVYKDYGDDKFLKKKNYINKHNGYEYVGVTMSDGKNKNHRVHKLVALAFVSNPNNYEIVGHKDNIKHHNNYKNLYWTTVKENTQKAYNDGLAKNAKGAEDSQSQAVTVFYNNEYLCEYGSIKECSRKLNIPVSTIIRRCKNEIKTTYRKYKEYDFKYKQVL